MRAYFWSPYLSHITRSTCTCIWVFPGSSLCLIVRTFIFFISTDEESSQPTEYATKIIISISWLRRPQSLTHTVEQLIEWCLQPQNCPLFYNLHSLFVEKRCLKLSCANLACFRSTKVNAHFWSSLIKLELWSLLSCRQRLLRHFRGCNLQIDDFSSNFVIYLAWKEVF